MIGSLSQVTGVQGYIYDELLHTGLSPGSVHVQVIGTAPVYGTDG